MFAGTLPPGAKVSSGGFRTWLQGQIANEC